MNFDAQLRDRVRKQVDVEIDTHATTISQCIHDGDRSFYAAALLTEVLRYCPWTPELRKLLDPKIEEYTQSLVEVRLKEAAHKVAKL